jgi:hypothetical protein
LKRKISKGMQEKEKKMVNEVEIVKGYFRIVVKVFFSCRWIGEE